jgi:adenylate cyclase
VPEVKEVTILFADIVGFTSMSETMSPAAVALVLNDYLSRMTDVIFKWEGTLDKYIGDAIMAVFGAPLDMPDHASRAISAALEMRERLEEFNAERSKEGPLLRIRMGINTGKAVAGEIGSINKKEYTVLGDTVNTASRLESSVAKPGMIVIGENTYLAVKDQFVVNSLGKAKLKGKAVEVPVYEVLSTVGAAAQPLTPRPGEEPAATPLPGAPRGA